MRMFLLSGDKNILSARQNRIKLNFLPWICKRQKIFFFDDITVEINLYTVQLIMCQPIIRRHLISCACPVRLIGKLH